MAFLIPAAETIGQGVLSGIASTVGGAIANNAMNSSSSKQANMSSNYSPYGTEPLSSAGSGSSPSFSIDDVRQLAAKKGITLSAQDETDLSQTAAQRASSAQSQSILDLQRQQAPLYNNIANSNAERTMALNAQQNAATNVANQLNNLNQFRIANGQTIANVLNSTASIFH